MSNSLTVLRENKQYTQALLAEKLGVSRQAVSSWETGTRTPPLKVAIALAQLMEVNVEDIVFGTKKME